jgi:hypothetical protein
MHLIILILSFAALFSSAIAERTLPDGMTLLRTTTETIDNITADAMKAERATLDKRCQNDECWNYNVYCSERYAEQLSRRNCCTDL